MQQISPKVNILELSFLDMVVIASGKLKNKCIKLLLKKAKVMMLKRLSLTQKMIKLENLNINYPFSGNSVNHAFSEQLEHQLNLVIWMDLYWDKHSL